MDSAGRLFRRSVTAEHYDLDLLAGQVRDLYFPEQDLLDVRWGKMPPQRKRQSIRLGSYDPRSSEIRVHPLLDCPTVPVWFIQSVIHHEYLHHLLGPRHDRRFRAFESRFTYHREAEAWLGRHLMRLLGRRNNPSTRKRKSHTVSFEQARLF